MTNGREDGGSSGSDSEPSADNLDEEELFFKPLTSIVSTAICSCSLVGSFCSFASAS